MSTLTRYMSLTAWTDATDPYSHVEFANNLLAIDRHDHSSGKGVQINTPGLTDRAVTSTKLAQPAVANVNLFPASVTADKLDPTIFAAVSPLGVVQGFWRPSGSSLVCWGNRASGYLFELCDGRTIASAEHDMGVGSITLPNLIDQFAIYGTPANLGVTGGTNSLNLSHGHTVNPHSHTVNAHGHTVSAHHHQIGDHRHGISAVGDHGHTFAGGKGVRSRLNALLQGIQVQSWDLTTDAPLRRSNSLQSLYIGGFNNGSTDDAAPMDLNGGHDHGGQTGFLSTGNLGTDDASPGTSNASPGTDSQSPGTNAALGSVDNRPAFLTLVPVVRVRNFA